MPRRLSAFVVASLLVAACGDDGAAEPPADDAPTSTTTTVPAPPPLTGADLADEGPFEVGVTTRALPTGNAVEIWYPADDSADGRTETYSVRSFIGILEGLISAEIDDTSTIEASRDHGSADGGPFPVVLFSHGAASFRLQSSTLARHLASWGMVVASPDHPSRELVSRLGAPTADPPESADDLRRALAILADAAGDPVLDGAADVGRVGLGGHSAGGGTILAVAADAGVEGYVSYASGAGDRELPDVPSLFMAGSFDAIVEPSTTRAAFEQAPSPSWYWEIGSAGHLAFSDLCAIGGGDSTLIDLAEQAGIGEVVPDDLRALATDGCEDPNRPVQDVWPAIHQASTGFYRWIFGIDEEPVGLDDTTVRDVQVVMR